MIEKNTYFSSIYNINTTKYITTKQSGTDHSNNNCIKEEETYTTKEENKIKISFYYKY